MSKIKAKGKKNSYIFVCILLAIVISGGAIVLSQNTQNTVRNEEEVEKKVVNESLDEGVYTSLDDSAFDEELDIQEDEVEEIEELVIEEVVVDNEKDPVIPNEPESSDPVIVGVPQLELEKVPNSIVEEKIEENPYAQIEDVEKYLSQVGLDYFLKNYGDQPGAKEAEAKVINYGCHLEIHIYKGNQLIMELVYFNGEIYEI